MGKILYAEDDEAMREMVTEILVKAGHTVRTVSNGTAALAELRSDEPDLILLDYRMGEPNGFEVCRRIKTDPGLEHLPVLMLTAESELENRIAGFDAGANDYLPKPFDSRELLARVRALLRLSEQGRELNPTTGLPGGTSIEREFERRRALGDRFTLTYLDLDFFKPFNDRFGFPMANGLIESVGRLLRKLVSDSHHFAAHIGGDDFVLISEQGVARHLAERIQKEFEEAVRQVVPPEVAAAGSYRGKLRSGVEGDVPLTRISAAILHLDPSTVPPYTEMGEMAAKAKKLAKESGTGGVVEVEVDS